MSYAAVFAGQGSQTVEMAQELLTRCPQAAPFYRQASELTGTDLLRLDEADLAQTRVAQIAIVVRSLAEWFSLTDQEQHPWSALAGFSLGEYTALAAAGVLDLNSLLRLVTRRAELMDQASRQNPGTMFAILGLDDAAVERVCADPAYKGKVWPVNYNAPGQVVISGQTEATAACADVLRQAGARRAMKLNVSGAFHTPLMADAAAELAAFARTFTFAPPAIPLYGNVDASSAPAGRDWPEYLRRQMCSPVLWSEVVRQLSAAGVRTWREFGPGRVLSGLIRKTDPAAQIVE